MFRARGNKITMQSGAMHKARRRARGEAALASRFVKAFGGGDAVREVSGRRVQTAKVARKFIWKNRGHIFNNGFGHANQYP
jgi:hypothetical protein